MLLTLVKAQLNREEVVVMATVIMSLVIGVVSSLIGNYIYDKFIK